MEGTELLARLRAWAREIIAVDLQKRVRAGVDVAHVRVMPFAEQCRWLAAQMRLEAENGVDPRIVAATGVDPVHFEKLNESMRIMADLLMQAADLPD